MTGLRSITDDDTHTDGEAMTLGLERECNPVRIVGMQALRVRNRNMAGDEGGGRTNWLGG